jgi:predicted nucleic acid-binding protein
LRRTEPPSAERPFAYADASALAKLVIREPESDAVQAYAAAHTLVTSELSLVEVVRAVKIARPDPERVAEAERLINSLDRAGVSRAVIGRAAELASVDLRSLDAIHLATAERVGAAEMLTYDRRLAAAAHELGMRVACPA